MRFLTRKLIIFLGAVVPMYLSSSPYLDEEDIEEAWDNVENLEKEMASLSLYNTKLLQRSKELKKSGYLGDEIERHRQLDLALKSAMEAFVEFREKLSDVLVAANGGYPCGRLRTEYQITEANIWYVNYIKKVAFPEYWEEIYQSYLDEGVKAFD